MIPEGKSMSFSVGSRIVNVYGELANIVKFNDSRLEEAIMLYSRAISVEGSPSMQAQWLVHSRPHNHVY